MPRSVDDVPSAALAAPTLDVVAHLPPRSEALPVLTIVYHPDARRVGQVARLDALRAGQRVLLSRLTPRFAEVTDPARGEALADPFVSRRAVMLERTAAGFVLTADGEGRSVVADGSPVVGAVVFSVTALETGVTLELSDRVVLLWHVVDPTALPRVPRLGLVGENDAIERVRRDVLQVADLDVSVLIRGETGTGKELVAQAIHAASGRRAAPCVCVNMAAVSAAVAASELFGHVRGAFTGAVRDAPGYFAQAEGGTLFLDEVGETPPAVQSMLLRVLETREVQPVGASATRKVNVRLIAATDADLDAGVRDGRFGAALLHRLASFEVLLPPLRTRRDDLGRLFFHFLREELALVGESARLDEAPPAAPPWVPPALVARLVRFAWPGNVRQLRNVVRQLVISSRGAPRLHVGAAVERLFAPVVGAGAPPAGPALRPGPAPRRKPSTISHEDLVAALRGNGWRREAAARQLGIAVSSLYGLIERCPLLRKAHEIPRDELARVHAACAGDLERMAERLEVSTQGLKLRMRELGIA